MPSIKINSLSWVVLLLFFAACAEADDQGTNQVNKKTNNNNVTNTNVTSTATGMMTGTNMGTSTGGGCQNPCTPGETKCEGDKVSACVADAQGCLVWQAGVDCAAQGQKCEGIAPAMCVALAESCRDGDKNGDETDVDCGGSCGRCPEGKVCTAPTDCATETCTQNVCQKKPTGGGDCQNEGAKQCGATGVETCQGGKWTQTEACAMGCKNLVCVGVSACTDGQSQCDGNTPQTCVGGKFVSAGQSCPQGCDMGKCVQTVSCTANESRCLGPIVQRCNATGTAWTFDTLCQDRCENSLCVGTCTPDEVRCNGNQRETCQQDGKTWSSTETCANGCDQGVCIANGYTNSGLKETKQGVEVVTGCWTIELSGEVEVPADESLEVFADCVKITDSGKLTLGSGATAIFHAKTVEIDGTLTGGQKLTFKGSQTLRFGGSAQTTRELWFWSDKLTIDADAEYTTVSKIWALYGATIDNKAPARAGLIESVMPPFEINSSTHPSDFTWNWSGDNIYLSWERPFPGVVGYYVHVGSDTPTPDNAELTTQESISLSSDLFHDGYNTVRVISVNQDNTLGIHSQSFDISINTQAPVMSSSSHTSSQEWNQTDDVFMNWSAPENVIEGSWIGYAWEWNEKGDHIVNLQSAMLNTEEQKLFPDQPKGEQHFHIVALDRLGRTTPMAGRYTVRIGDEPEKSNIAGTITNAITQEPILNATISLDGDVLTAGTGTAGDFTFGGSVYVRSTPYTLRVSAPGYVPQDIPVDVKNPTTVTKSVALMPKAMGADRYQFGFDTRISSNTVWAGVEVGPKDHFVYTDGQRISVMSMTHGRQASLEERAMDVGWIGESIWLIIKTGLGYQAQRFDSSLKTKLTSDHNSRRLSSSSRQSFSTGRGVTTDDTVVTFLYGTYFSSPYMFVNHFDHNLSAPPSSGGFDALNMISNAAPSAHVWNSKKKVVATIYGYNRDQLQIYESSSIGRRGTLKAHELNVVGGKAVSAIFDGTSYHAAYVARNQSGLPRPHLVKINADDLTIQGMPLELSAKDDTPASIVFDGTNLLVAYKGKLETRSITDQSLLHTQDLPEYFVNPTLEMNKETGRAVLFYSVDSANLIRGLFPE